MYVLLLICNALCPQPLDESLEKPIREKHAGFQMDCFFSYKPIKSWFGLVACAALSRRQADAPPAGQ